MTNQDQILRAHSILTALKSNIPEHYEVSERWVADFHAAIEKLEAETGLNLTEFRVAPSELKKSVASSNYLTGEVTYRNGLWCERALLMQRLDSILSYFTGLQTGKDRRIGFRRLK